LPIKTELQNDLQLSIQLEPVEQRNAFKVFSWQMFSSRSLWVPSVDFCPFSPSHPSFLTRRWRGK